MALVVLPITGHRTPPDKGGYTVYECDKLIGQICQTPVPGSTVWFWTLCGRVAVGEPPECGLANTLEDALAEFKAAWQKVGQQYREG